MSERKKRVTYHVVKVNSHRELTTPRGRRAPYVLADEEMVGGRLTIHREGKKIAYTKKIDWSGTHAKVLAFHFPSCDEVDRNTESYCGAWNALPASYLHVGDTITIEYP